MLSREQQARMAEATAALQQGRPNDCQRICTELLATGVDDPGLRHMRGVAAAQAGDAATGIGDLTIVVREQPVNTHASFWLGRLLRQQGEFTGAEEHLRRATMDTQLAQPARYELARCLVRLRRSEESIALYRQNLAEAGEDVHSAANLAFLLERANQLEQAAEMARIARRIDPGNFMASLTQATIWRRQGQAGQASQLLQELLSRTTDVMNRSIVLQQLGQAEESLGNYAVSLEHHHQSNLLLRRQHPHGTPDPHGPYSLGQLQRWQQELRGHPPETWAAADVTGPQPIFLVGFPRSGTTLLDQALSAHPQIEVLEEVDLLEPVRQRWLEQDGVAGLARMTVPQLSEARRVYLDTLAAHRRHPQRPWVIDKLPLNAPFLFLVHRLFPKARILFLLRDPRDACLSCYLQSFDLVGAMPYFLDLGDTTRYYDQVMTLAEDSIEAGGMDVHRIHYESMVEEFEPCLRQVLAYLGIEWSPAVLDYRHAALEKTIDTPSYQQVVQPLYRNSIGRWRKFFPHGEPRLARLGPWVERYGYAS